ncbi:1,2-dihydroxy-3-keto-5-methylthiopentene dioxygenase [Dipsacomyces acuminosporus]|nr:1,2-dihydroxy-3-keto-5-methylthiopentene dioxygenase [Dipsacomyces acuminosporus]
MAKRLRLKAKLNASEKRIAQLGSLYGVSQKHIAILESLLREAQAGSGVQQQQRALNSNSTNISKELDEDSDNVVTVSDLVAATENTRINSRKLLTRCLTEIDTILGGSGGSTGTTPPIDNTQKLQLQPQPQQQQQQQQNAQATTSPKVPRDVYGFNSNDAIQSLGNIRKVSAIAQPIPPNGVIETNEEAVEEKLSAIYTQPIPQATHTSSANNRGRGDVASTLLPQSAPVSLAADASAATTASIASEQKLNQQQQQQQQQQQRKVSIYSSSASTAPSYPSSLSQQKSDFVDKKRRTSQPPPVITMTDISTEYRKRQGSHSDTERETSPTAKLESKPQHESVGSEAAGFPKPFSAASTASSSQRSSMNGMASVDDAPETTIVDAEAGINDDITSLTVDEVDISEVGRNGGEPALLKTFTGHLDTVRSIRMRQTAMDGPQLLSGSDDGMVQLWSIERNERRRSRRRLANEVLPASIYRGHLAAVTSVQFAEYHELAYSASLDSSIKVWALPGAMPKNDPSTSTAACFPVYEFAGHSDAVWDLALSVSTSLLVSVSADGTSNIWSIDPKHRASPLRASLRYQSIGFELLSGSGGRAHIDTSPAAIPTSVCFAAEDCAQIAIAYSSCTINVHDTATGGLSLSLRDKPEQQQQGQGQGQQPTQITKIVSNSGLPNIIAAAYSNGFVQLFDARVGRSITASGILAHDRNGIAATAIDMDHASTLVTGGSDGIVKWWDRRNTSKCLYEVAANQTKGDEGVCSVSILASSPSNTQQLTGIGTAGADGLIKLFKY